MVQLFSISATVSETLPREQQRQIFEVMGVAERIFTTPGLDARLLVQAAYILENGCRATREYPVTLDRHISYSDTVLRQREEKYRDYIARYDQTQKDLRALRITSA